MHYTAEVFSSDGTLAIQRDGQDILHVTRVDRVTAADDAAEKNWHVMSDEEHTSLIVLIVKAITPWGVADDEFARALRVLGMEES